MVRIQGPDLSIHGTLTPHTAWVHVIDHYSVRDLDTLLYEHGCKQVKIFQDFFWLSVDSDFTTLFAPTWLQRFCRFAVTWPDVPTVIPETKHCFNFMIYKLRSPRQTAIQALIDRHLVTECYTLCEQNHTSIKAKTYRNGRQKVYNNTADYNDFLRPYVFDHSAVALITETIEPEWHNNMTFTEKTIWPMLSYNFPIWLGGYRQADLWKAVGFDVFEDIVNHDYQWEPDPYRRISRALDENLRLLTDLDYVSNLRLHMQQRLSANQTLVLDQHIESYGKTVLDGIDIPEDLLCFINAHGVTGS